MATILTHAVINDAKSAVDTYVAEVRSLNDNLTGLIRTLTANNFIGDASNGYMDFFNSKVVPALTTNLVDGESITAGIKSILDTISEQLLDSVDPQLGDFNRNPQ